MKRVHHGASTPCSNGRSRELEVQRYESTSHAYPNGGFGFKAALAEAFGSTLLGVNEFGRSESLEKLFEVEGGL